MKVLRKRQTQFLHINDSTEYRMTYLCDVNPEMVVFSDMKVARLQNFKEAPGVVGEWCGYPAVIRTKWWDKHLPTRKKFFRHQWKAWRYATRERNEEAIELFMQMRLGKSLIFQRWAEMKGPPCLIICPISSMVSWEKELAGDGHETVILEGPSPKKLKTLEENFEHFDWFLVNPEGVRACPEIIANWDWMVLGIDEASFLRNNSAVTKKLKKIAPRIPYRACLTGTPNPESHIDFCNQFLVTRGEFMGETNYWKWLHKYHRKVWHDFEPHPGVRKKVRAAVGETAFSMRVEDAGLFMKRVHVKRHVKAPPAIMAAIARLKKHMECGYDFTKWAVVQQSWLCQLASGICPKEYDISKQPQFSSHKVNEVVRIMTEEVKGKAVIMTRSTRMSKLIVNALQKQKIKCARLIGKTPLAVRRERIAMLHNGQIKALVGQQQKVMEKGLDLSPADVLIFVENVWSWETRHQCEARADHPTKTRPTLIIDIIAQNTIDEAVVEALHEKKVDQRGFIKRVAKIAERLNVA